MLPKRLASRVDTDESRAQHILAQNIVDKSRDRPTTLYSFSRRRGLNFLILGRLFKSVKEFMVISVIHPCGKCAILTTEPRFHVCDISYSFNIIEIINNTRGGIVILIQSKKGNAAIGGQKIKMLK